MFEPQVRGKVWRFGDHISTDYMKPSFARGETLQEQATFCMQAIRPTFASEVRPGDVIVAGKNFGCGSSRPAGQNLMTLGISCVIAESFARIFFRGSIGLGLPLLSCPGISEAFREGDILQADFRTGEIRNVTSGLTLQANPLPDVALRILEGGGLMALLKQEYGGGQQ